MTKPPRCFFISRIRAFVQAIPSFTPYYIALFQCRFEFLDISRRSVPLHTFEYERMGVQKRKKRFISRNSVLPYSL